MGCCARVTKAHGFDKEVIKIIVNAVISCYDSFVLESLCRQLVPECRQHNGGGVCVSDVQLDLRLHHETLKNPNLGFGKDWKVKAENAAVEVW